MTLLSLCCGTQASPVAAAELSFPAACGILVPWPGIEPMSPALEGGFLATGSPRKSPFSRFYNWGEMLTCSRNGLDFKTCIRLQIYWLMHRWTHAPIKTRIEPGSLALRLWSLSHWTIREVPWRNFYFFFWFIFKTIYLFDCIGS